MSLFLILLSCISINGHQKSFFKYRIYSFDLILKNANCHANQPIILLNSNFIVIQK